MRTLISKLAVLPMTLVACGTSEPPGQDVDAGTDLMPPARGFQIKSPDVTIMPGQEVTYCYYFHTPNTDVMAIKRWASHMTAGSHHMILFLATGTGSQPPDGTLTTQSCGLGASATNIPAWAYLAQTADAASDLPADDGTGVPVGHNIPANQAAYFQMHYLNASDVPISGHVELNGYAYDVGTAVTPASPYITYNTQIDVPPRMNGVDGTGSVTGTCAVPATAKFFNMSTHAHKQAVETLVKNGPAMVFHSDDWEHPGEVTWQAQPFFTFSSGALSYQCNYKNPNSYAVHTGPSAATDEMCMAVGYFFPATKPKICLDSQVVQ